MPIEMLKGTFGVRFAVRNGERETVEEAGRYWLDEGEVFVGYVRFN